MSTDRPATHDRLLEELAELRERLAGLEDAEQRWRATEGELRQSQRMLQLVLDTIPVRVFWKDRKSVYVGCNMPLARDCGYSDPAQLVGKTDFETASAQTAEIYRADDRQVMETGQPKLNYEEPQVKPDGSPAWLSTSKVPLRDGEGRVIGVLGTYEDITERKRAEAALKQRTEELDRFFSLALDLLCIADVEGRFLRLNRAWEQTLGYRVDELEGLPFMDFVHPDDREATAAAVRRLAGGETVVNFVNRYRCRDGSYRWVEWRSSPFENRLIYSAGRDVTERRQTEEALREQNTFRRAIIERAGDGLCVFHRVERSPFIVFTVWNPRMTEIFGYTAEEANRVGWLGAFFPQPESQARARERMERLLAGEDLVAEEWEVSRKDGTQRVIAVSTSVLGEKDGARQVMALVRDLTERRRSEEERRRFEAQLLHTQKLESLGVLAGGIAHDFNNLLVALLGNAELAVAELPPASSALPFVRNIEVASSRAAELCRQMLAYSGRGSFVVEALDLSEVVREITHMLEVSISKKALLRYDLAPGLPAVEADPSQVRQVVMNLITNASEAIGERNGVISLTTGLMACDRTCLADTVVDDGLPEGRYVFIEVADTGCGMTPDVQSRVFDPFFSTKFAGRGLGMAAVLGIVRGHRGAIKVESEPERGTRVRVLFPASRQVRGSRPERVSGPRHEPVGGIVLVVDDDENVRPVTQMMLERLGFEVLLARDGREGLDVYGAHRDGIVCVLLDLTMPEMDGEETLHALREIDPEVRVILSSGYNQLEVVQRFAGQGLAGFIQKPYRLADLKAILEKTLGL